MSFVNFSNHRSEYWNETQKKAAKEWGNIIDVPFPKVDAEASEDEIARLAEKSVQEIMKHTPNAVMCQGEFTLTYAVIQRLKERNVQVVSACSERETTEEYFNDGTSLKHSEFHFVRFRRYE